MAETKYDELLKKLGLTDEAAIKKWQKEYGLDQTGTWGAAEQAAYVYMFHFHPPAMIFPFTTALRQAGQFPGLCLPNKHKRR